ncbi:DNA-directed RNA polymerase II subunit rpb7 [Smittium culicis]|uniref:DNA-directed RNA polymerase II subunit rpb7 n=1 Tax=Smittium culicis TaxID=133412 RepID=A0A1R1YKR9_9FUNG|nr:DNA-directed RNA polymerase II subunit rpb7 [Smittium culicis]
MRQFVTEKLYQDVEGSCTGRFGYIVTVLALVEIGVGTILPGNGSAEFKVKYSAIVYKPYKGQVVDGVVNNVNKLIPADMKFDPNGNPPNYHSEDQKIEKGTPVRLKIVGTRVDATEIFVIGTIKEDYLGVIE